MHEGCEPRMTHEVTPLSANDGAKAGRATAASTWRPTTASGAVTPRPAQQPERRRRRRCHRAGAQPGVAASLPAPPGAGLRLSEEDRAALRFLIESLNDDGYLEDTLDDRWRAGLAGSDEEQVEELVHHFTVALGLLQSLEPAGVGARDLGECLRCSCGPCRPGADSRPMPQQRRCWRWPCASAPSPWTCWPGATSSAWCSCAAARRRDARRHRADRAAGAQARAPLCRRGAQHRGARRAGGQGRPAARRPGFRCSSTPT